MINKKLILVFIVINFLGACTSPTAMLGPMYTISSSGSVIEAGLSFSSNEIITRKTGKSPIENLKEFSSNKNGKAKNIQLETIKSEDFYQLVKNKITKTSRIINISSQ